MLSFSFHVWFQSLLSSINGPNLKMTYSGQDPTKENYIIPTDLNTNFFLQNISLSFGEGFSEDVSYTIHSLYKGITNVKMGHIIQYFNHQSGNA